MPENLKELAIILVAREWDSDIEWTGHSILAAKAGVSDGSIEAIRTHKTADGLTKDETVVAKFVHEMIRDKKVSDGTYSDAEKLVGQRGTVDLTLTVSYYSALALAQIALQLEMEPGRESTL
jgi:4-carboxymuconolactone decarboxylase